MDRAHRRVLDRGLGRFSPEATATNLIYFFPHRRTEFRVYPFIETSSAASAIKLGYFFARPPNFSALIDLTNQGLLSC
jgi:hypothetical protein